jgi:hypothetical protein
MIVIGLIMNQYMLKHLTKNRVSDKFRGFSYRKVLVDSSANKRGIKSKVIAWEVSYSNVPLATVSTLKEVKYYISTKVTTL